MSSPGPLHFLHIDDHRLFREGVASLLRERWPEAEMAGSSGYQDGLEKAWKREWSLIILDISLDGRSGVDLLRDIRGGKKQTPILILTMLPENHLASRVFRLGASGFICKDASRRTLLEAVEALLAGKRFITPSAAQQMVSQMAGDTEKPPHEALSDREFVVMQCLAAGQTVKSIASQMGLSVKTVSTYRSRLLEKMNFQTNSDLVRYCLDNHLGTPREV